MNKIHGERGAYFFIEPSIEDATMRAIPDQFRLMIQESFRGAGVDMSPAQRHLVVRELARTLPEIIVFERAVLKLKLAAWYNEHVAPGLTKREDIYKEILKALELDQ